MKVLEWIKSQAAARQPLNLHAVARARPGFLKSAFSGRCPRGWYRTLLDAGVNPYQIIHEHTDEVQCPWCDYHAAVLGSHLKSRHGMGREDYQEELGQDFELSSEQFRADKFRSRPIHGIEHWEQLWSRYYVIDWILRLREGGHPLNFHTLNQQGQSLTHSGIKYFGSWDAALLAAGLKPKDERAIPVFRQWTPEVVIQELRQFAKRKKTNWRMQMPMDLRCAIVRTYGKPAAAAKAAGLRHEDISHRAIFSSHKVTRLVDAIRKLEKLKGKARLDKLSAIYHNDDENRRIIQNSYGSLRKLALSEGISLRAISPRAYRDRADVMHDLDLIERSGKSINFTSLKKGHKRLYNVISETGWGRNRLGSLKSQPS